MSIDRLEMPDTGDPRYQSYLLRLWQGDLRGEKRALLLDILSRESRHFPDLESLFAYLNEAKGQPGEEEADSAALLGDSGNQRQNNQER